MSLTIHELIDLGIQKQKASASVIGGGRSTGMARAISPGGSGGTPGMGRFTQGSSLFGGKNATGPGPKSPGADYQGGTSGARGGIKSMVAEPSGTPKAIDMTPVQRDGPKPPKPPSIKASSFVRPVMKGVKRFVTFPWRVVPGKYKYPLVGLGALGVVGGGVGLAGAKLLRNAGDYREAQTTGHYQQQRAQMQDVWHRGANSMFNIQNPQ